MAMVVETTIMLFVLLLLPTWFSHSEMIFLADHEEISRQCLLKSIEAMFVAMLFRLQNLINQRQEIDRANEVSTTLSRFKIVPLTSFKRRGDDAVATSCMMIGEFGICWPNVA